jgi:hypothetical protein
MSFNALILSSVIVILIALTLKPRSFIDGYLTKDLVGERARLTFRNRRRIVSICLMCSSAKSLNIMISLI